MNKFRFSILSFCLLFVATMQAQEISYGFKAGLNFNWLIADSELTDDGMMLEEYTGKNGFHVGATFGWAITDLMGVRSEFLFSQKGYKRRYNGASFFLGSLEQPVNVTTGNRNMFLSVVNSYIDVPIIGYAKLTKWLEVHAGASVGILVNSTAIGGLTYTLDDGQEIQYDFDIRFGGDEVGDFDEAGNPETVFVNGEPFVVPRTVGAYYEYREDVGNYHNFLDIGLVGGFSLYLNKGLYIGVRANYGLSDVTSTRADYSYRNLDSDGNFITRDDNDYNLSVQTSVGFNF